MQKSERGHIAGPNHEETSNPNGRPFYFKRWEAVFFKNDNKRERKLRNYSRLKETKET